MTLKELTCTLATSLLLACATLTSPWAEPAALPKPSGAPILTVEGDIAVTNENGKAVFDRQMLEALGMRVIVTDTPWYDQAMRFEGVPVELVLERVGAKGSELTAVALNDYKVEIPMSDFSQYPVILALKRNDTYMPISDKGPIFVVYPYDDYSELHAQKYYGRSVWQLSRMTIN